MLISPTLLAAAITFTFTTFTTASQEQEQQQQQRRRQSTEPYVGYFGTFFPLQDEAIYGWLSNGNNAHSWRQLNGRAGNGSLLRSNVGTRGVRDSHVVRSREGSSSGKFWLIATDLNVNSFKEDFNEATRFGSRSMVVWETTGSAADEGDLATWSAARLTVPLVDVAAGNVWAPEAEWDASVGAYVVVFASRFWDPKDVNRTGPQPPNQLMYVTTQDFETFSEARVYEFQGTPVIDATFYHASEEGNNVWYRWIKEEVNYTIYQERSESGILGQFSRVGGAPLDERITFASQYENNEGPLIFHDNLDPGLYHLWIDENTLQSYIPATARTLDDMHAWKAQSLDGFPKSIKHGSVIPVTQVQYDALVERYGFV